ncbi:uncharacterized protein SOCEGT47_038820 [Sorangium cellulosum]|uniref:Uncharacterized protein n=2 Tax=Sorangium cellulosum TaxID=56 RepID=A0A4P2Q279_SORCE|nr:uncharacterized protein SOCEGT47_038820 [Sorangium cellulosum]
MAPDLDEEDPVLRAFRLAPVVYDEQISDEEREAVAAGAAGPFTPHEEVRAEVRRRAEAEGALVEYEQIMRTRGRTASRLR